MRIDRTHFGISQDLVPVKGGGLEIVFDLFNHLHLLDRDRGHVNIVTELRDLIVTFHSRETNAGSPYGGHPWYVWGKPNPAPRVLGHLGSRWQAQLGIRCAF
jgi:hypothetical protein